MLQIGDFKHLVADRFLVQAKPLDFAANLADQLDAAECRSVLAERIVGCVSGCDQSLLADHVGRRLDSNSGTRAALSPPVAARPVSSCPCQSIRASKLTHHRRLNLPPRRQHARSIRRPDMAPVDKIGGTRLHTAMRPINYVLIRSG